MENHYQPYGQNASLEKSIFNPLEIDQNGKANLAEAAKWAKFMGIIGLVMLVLLVLVALLFITVGDNMFTSSQVPGMPFGKSVLGMIYLFIAALYFYPSWTLLKFGTQTRRGIKTENQIQFNHGLRNLKNCFKFIGVLTVIVIALYVVSIIAVAVGVGIGTMR